MGFGAFFLLCPREKHRLEQATNVYAYEYLVCTWVRPNMSGSCDSGLHIVILVQWRFLEPLGLSFDLPSSMVAGVDGKRWEDQISVGTENISQLLINKLSTFLQKQQTEAFRISSLDGFWGVDVLFSGHRLQKV